jgi:hypothetical protein
VYMTASRGEGTGDRESTVSMERVYAGGIKSTTLFLSYSFFFFGRTGV